MEINVVTISIEEYKDLVRTAIKAEYDAQAEAMQKEFEAKEAELRGMIEYHEKDALDWWRKYNDLKKENARLKDDLSFYTSGAEKEDE